MTNTSAKKDSTKVETTEAAAPKERRAARTLEQRIAELQAQAEARAEKRQASARKKFDDLVEQFLKAEAKVVDLGSKLIEARGEYDFELPESISVTREQVEKLQVAAQAEEAEAAAADEAQLDDDVA